MKIVLAPMRALTQPPFWQILNTYGPPDAFFSEFVRVHENYVIDPSWIETSLQAAGATPLWVQLMGNDISALAKSVNVLERYPIAGIDFNVGCPVPKIFKKQAGGGLLKDLALLRDLVFGLRDVCQKPLSVKFRIGFDATDHFDEILDILIEAGVDVVTLHARTVMDLYKAPPRYEFVKKAVERCPFPVFANGSIDSLEDILRVFKLTRCAGVMLGRCVLRNPWIFEQWRCLCKHQPVKFPTWKDVYCYFQDLFYSFALDKKPETAALGCLKRFANYIGLGVDADGIFLSQMRLSKTLGEFWKCCDRFFLKNPDHVFDGNAFPKLCAQPNKEKADDF